MTFESTRPAAEKSFMRTAIGHVVFFFKRALLPIHLFEEIRVFQPCACDECRLRKLECFQACASSRYQLRKLERFKHALMEIRVFQAYACGRCCDTETSRSLSLLRTCACAQVRLLPFSLSCHTVVACLCAHSPPARRLTSSHHHGSSSMKNIHFQPHTFLVTRRRAR